ncbi:hypothetical protein DUNSADRAFT_3023 [Dunaliella salina]|uniref:Uncharacterized protein n=1 Tax=Dunaliella salina TaxID=3046 RepID=A0ABQ7FVQ1_DUNSA|nr:hypothetical protein DUNSADRAFT_3023 [Dunaliella salina]|eukprot:KAF5826468.1 hypothetical protein DUNSADRAFT_3023 [Dunaliella salina]
MLLSDGKGELLQREVLWERLASLQLATYRKKSRRHFDTPWNPLGTIEILLLCLFLCKCVPRCPARGTQTRQNFMLPYG